jgi:hypothetical protein
MSIALVAPTGELTARCEHCRYRLDDQRKVEQYVAGLTSFGSAYGASIGDSRLCDLHDCWVSPADNCAGFQPRGG